GVARRSRAGASSRTTGRSAPPSANRIPARRPSACSPGARAAMWSALSGSRPCTDFTSPSQESRTALEECGTRCPSPLISQSRSDTMAVGASLAVGDRLLGLRRSVGALVEGAEVVSSVPEEVGGIGGGGSVPWGGGGGGGGGGGASGLCGAGSASASRWGVGVPVEVGRAVDAQGAGAGMAAVAPDADGPGGAWAGGCAWGYG